MTSKTTRSASSVEEYMAELEHPHKAAVQQLRRVILAVHPGIQEAVKWNAPSFALAEHFATMRLHPAPLLQLILHTGAKAKAKPRKFEIADPQLLLKWAAPDRAVIAFASASEVAKHTPALRKVLKAWIAQL